MPVGYAVAKTNVQRRGSGQNAYLTGGRATTVSYDDSRWRPDPGLQSYDGHEIWTHHVGPHQIDSVGADDGEEDVEAVFRRVYEENEEFDGDFDEEFDHLFEGDGGD